MIPVIDPYAIYAQAQAYWLSQRYPQLLAYRVVVRIVEGGKERVERYETRFDATGDDISVDPVSDFEKENPVRPPGGLNVSLFGFYRIGKPEPQVDFLGVPLLTPTYSFGMAPFVPAPEPTPFNSAALVAEIRKEYHDPDPRVTPTPTPSAEPPVIAVVVAAHRTYIMRYVGQETVNGHLCYHVSLRAVHDPGKYRLRDVWVDENDYAVWRLRVGINFTSGPGTQIPWTVDFTDIDGEHYIDREIAGAPMAVAGEIYTQTTVEFENVGAAGDEASPMPLQLPLRNTLEEPTPIPAASSSR
jgi:hypothetical protein